MSRSSTRNRRHGCNALHVPLEHAPWLIPHSAPEQHGEPMTPQVVHAPFVQPHVAAAVHCAPFRPCMQHPPPVQTLLWQHGSPSCPHFVVHV
jgi:hypothetical protein